MDDGEKLYRQLQLVLDRETLGFPETPSGSDIRLLMALFTSEQAKAVIHLTYKFSTVDEIHERAANGDFTREELENVLDGCARRGLIAYKKQDAVKYYRTIHYLLGMAEGGLHGGKPNPEFLSAMNQCAKDGLFWKAFLRTKVSQMRTVPIEQSLSEQKHVATFDRIREIVLNSAGPFVVYECACRKGAGLAGHPCSRTSRAETCMSLGKAAEGIICLGCGNCVARCPVDAIALVKREEEFVPPLTGEDLNEVIMTNKR